MTGSLVVHRVGLAIVQNKHKRRLEDLTNSIETMTLH